MKEEDELTYGETINKPFPKLENIDNISIKTTWDMDKFTPKYVNDNFVIELGMYVFYKALHENSRDFKVTWKLKQTDPHAEIKAQYEEALKKYDVVKVFCSHKESSHGWSKIDFKNMCDYKDDEFKFELRFYNIDWNKLLSWSYANGEFVECMFKSAEGGLEMAGKLFAYDDTIADEDVSVKRYLNMNTRMFYIHCRLTPNVTIKDEWLKEVK